MKLFRSLNILAVLLLTRFPAGSASETAGETVECANLIYAGIKTSKCFSDEFLSAVQQQTAIATERRFKSVKLAGDEIFQYPFVVITGENEFTLPAGERKNLKGYLEHGGFLLASAGCSSKEWDESFRREMRTLFPDAPLRKISFSHPLFRTVKTLETLQLKHDGTAELEGLELNGKIVVVYSSHGLNDTAHTEGCCCCGGNEILNSLDMNVNILVYALMQ